ncbi:beta-propeller fold lactonase family protein [Streptosporangiaceae bacterium NEAU-GS5]|nr:beta-propeller fold lactonase family protein [Streptosporangiaceae bacterium NEAU-GS5]
MRTRSTVLVFAALASSLLAASAASASASGQATRPRVLYVSGSTSMTVAMFTVDRQTGRLAPLADPVHADVEPTALAASPDGRFLYAAAPDQGKVLSFSVAESGRLSALDETDAMGGPFGLAVAPNGRILYAAVQDTDRVTSFSVGPDGRLTLLKSVASGGANPRAVAVSPDNRFVYVTSGLRDPAVPGVLSIFAAAGDGDLKLVKSMVIGHFGAGITISPDEGLLYVESQATSQIRGYRRGADGLLTELPGSPFPAPDDPEGIAITPDAQHVYAAATGQMANGTPGGRGEVEAFTVRPGGPLNAGRSSDAGALPNALTVSPSGRFLYVSNGDSSDISAFAIRPDGGLLQIPGVPAGKGIQDPGVQAITMLPNQGPTARFSFTPGLPTRFDATASDDPDGHVTRYNWDFGDGTVLANGGPTPIHVYNRSGGFTVTLTVTDDEGCSDHQIFTGQSMLCNGSPVARTSRTITK